MHFIAGSFCLMFWYNLQGVLGIKVKIMLEEDSFQFNDSMGKLNSRSRKTIIGKCNATPLVDVPNNNIPTW